MLGIRYFKSLAVDLWVGPSKDFISDQRITLAGKSDAAKFFQDTVNSSDFDSVRHVGVEVPETIASSLCERFIPDLKQALTGKMFEKLRRITFILPTVEHYNVYQKVLFEHFSEEPS